MIITMGGVPGSGKSSAANELAKRLGYKHYYIGKIRREMARERGITLAELNKIGESDEKTDLEPDKWMEEMGRKGDNIIFETRTGFHILPKSFKIFLDVDLKEGARRIFKQKGRESEKYKDINEAIKACKDRIESDRKRYLKYYGADFLDKKNYDLVIDTTKMNVKETVERIMEWIRKAK